MRARSLVRASLALLAAAGLAGCAGTSAPHGWLPDAAEAVSDAHGGWISVRLGQGSSRVVHEGELIAIQADSIFILEHETCIGVATAQVVSATLTEYDAQKGGLAVWTAMGALASLSHGYFAIISLPVWLIVGTLATTSQSYAPHLALTPRNWEVARAYARFPQGMPEGLDRSTLRPRAMPYDP